jgi:hypothetical protein
VKAANRSYFPADPVADCDPLVEGCTLESMSSDHLGIACDSHRNGGVHALTLRGRDDGVQGARRFCKCKELILLELVASFCKNAASFPRAFARREHATTSIAPRVSPDCRHGDARQPSNNREGPSPSGRQPRYT